MRWTHTPIQDTTSCDVCTLKRTICPPHPRMRQALRDAHNVMLASVPLSVPPLRSSTASVGECEKSDNSGTGLASRVSSGYKGRETAIGSEEAETAGAVPRGKNRDGLTEILKRKSEEIMERVLRLASLCEASGATEEIKASVERACPHAGFNSLTLPIGAKRSSCSLSILDTEIFLALGFDSMLTCAISAVENENHTTSTSSTCEMTERLSRCSVFVPVVSFFTLAIRLCFRYLARGNWTLCTLQNLAKQRG